MAEVILVQPRLGDWDDFRSHPSLPLALLSASRLVAKEFDIILIDTRIEKGWQEKLNRELKKNPLCVGITSLTGRQIGYALEISRYVKKISDVPVVWGGFHASLLPDSTLENKNIDMLVVGEGELSFLEIVRALANRNTLNGIPGICYKNNGKLIKNLNRDFVHLDDLPCLPINLIDLKKYLPLFKERRTFYIETSRGCPNRCAFCYNAAYNKSKWRAFPPERVINEIKNLYNHYRIKSFYIVDDNFFVDLKRAFAIAYGIINERLDIFWEAQGITVNSALNMDEDYLKILVKSGLKKVHFGLETASRRLLKKLNKNLKITDVIEINRRWNKYDIIMQYNIMCGFPGETIEDIRMTKDLVFQLMRENPNALVSPFCPYTPYPGTALYEESLRDGFICKERLADWQETNYGDNLWESKKKMRFLSSLFFTSMFLDKHRVRDMVKSRFVKFLINIYRPLAKFRIRHLYFGVMVEMKIKDLLLRFMSQERKVP